MTQGTTASYRGHNPETRIAEHLLTTLHKVNPVFIAYSNSVRPETTGLTNSDILNLSSLRRIVHTSYCVRSL